jgi:dihydrofolate synthase/folylpolyglutamate synthase
MPRDSLAWLFGLEQFGIKLGLDNITAIVAAMGRPDRAFAAAHVAGTNGKGSVSAMVEASLRAAGHRTGLFTSPHLVDLRERFVINGSMVDADALADVVRDIRTEVERLSGTGRLPALPTFFEVTTAAAFELFRRAAIDVAVCEVGLGGRLDATNILEPRVTAITSIAFDHERHLGTTLAAIATEKAGILKAGVPVVVGPLPDEADSTITRLAAALGSPVVRAGDVRAERVGAAGLDQPTRIRLESPARTYGEVVLSLRGEHQIQNAAVAVRMLEVLDASGCAAVPPHAITQGLASAHWPGRLDVRQLPDGRGVLLDAAHNPAGAATLARYIRETALGPRPLVFGAARDKDVEGMLRELVPVSSRLIATCSRSPRSEDPSAIAAVARRLAPELPVLVELDVCRALDAAWVDAPHISVAGSIFLLGDAINCLERS